MKHWIGALALLGSACAWAQMTPVGTWNSVDDDTKEVKAEIVIKDTPNGLTGTITKLLRPGADQKAVCDKCEDDRKGKPVIGLEIIRGAKKTEGKDVWEGGKILDPEKGSTYNLRLTPVEAGKKLDVRGSFGPFGRTQTWVRTN